MNQEPETTKKPNIKDCQGERAQQLEGDLNNPNSQVYIPECQAGAKAALWRPEQCAGKICFCVDIRDGSPIPNTTMQGSKPDCSKVKQRKFKKCPYEKLREFHDSLLDELATEMAAYAKNASKTGSIMPNTNANHSIEEAAIRWKFKALDHDNNQILSWSELKPKFTTQLEKGNVPSHLRKCRRNFIRYCDENSDRKVTLEEWIVCTGVYEMQNKQNKLQPKRNKENPFTNYLQP